MLRGFLTALWLFACAAQAAPRVDATPPRVVLGRDLEVRLRVHPEDGGGALRWSVSTGQLAPAGDGAFVWTPPDQRYPTRALLVFWRDDAARPPEPTVLEIPLLGRTELEMDTDPGAEVRVRVGGASFGPARASTRGRVRIAIEVPPGVREAEVFATVEGQRTTRTVPLEVPSTHPVAIALATETVPREGGYLLVAHPANVASSAIWVRSGSAQVQEVAARGDLSLFRVVPAEGASEVEIVVRVGDGDPHPLRARVAPPARPPPPAPIEPEAPPLPAAPLALQAQVGFFAAGGANLGPTLELGAAYALPVWERRLSVEGSVGFRFASLVEPIPSEGTLESNLLAVPVLASLRGRLFSRGPLAIDARAGVGAVPFRHLVSAPFQPSWSEGGIGAAAFLAAQGSYQVAPVEILLELRGEWTRLSTPHLHATPGGLVLGLGARWGIP